MSIHHSDSQNTYLTIGSVCASILIGLIIIVLVLSLYKNWKHHKTSVVNANTPNQDAKNIDVSSKSSVSSIYDEIELYDFTRPEHTHPTSPYTVLTRDPYGYDELYGLQRRIAILTDNPSQNNEEPNPSTSDFKAFSLPTDLNAMIDDDIETIEEEVYVDMLPEQLEASVDGGKIVRGCMGRSRSMNDVVKVDSKVKSEDQRKFNIRHQQKTGNRANVVSVNVQIH